MRQTLSVLVIAILLLAVTSCAGSGNAVTPPPYGDTTQSSVTNGSSHVLWGMWHCYMEQGSGQIQTIPMRGVCFTANVNNLLEANSSNLLIEDMDVTNFFTEGRLDCTIKLRHPLPGLDMYNGFDVWGVFMHNGNGLLDYDGLTYPADPNSDENVAVLLNPDGYTRWFNQPEFDDDGIPILEYWPGKLSNLPMPTATLNSFKIFADGLDLEDDYYEWITTPGNADDRGIFRAGMVNSRRYELEFPIIGGSPKVDFQYAVVATWEPGDPTLTGDPSMYDLFDFPTSANCEEAFFVNVSTIGSELYYADPGDFGGIFRADIEVFDWQGGSVGGLGIPNEVKNIIIEGNFVPGESHIFTQAELASVAIPATENSSVFQVEITGCIPQASGEADFWLIVESAGLNGESYYQGFPTDYPVGARRAAFLPSTVIVSGESSLDVIYVDDSNTSGSEDGSMAHPYNTVQEGVDAAALLVGYEVWVDDSGNPYEEQVNMASGTVLRSVNWDESDGSNRAFIDGPEDPETHSVYFNNVTDATIEGFRIGFAGAWPFGFPERDGTHMIEIDGGSDNTIRDCLFTGDCDLYGIFCIVMTDSENITIEHCSMSDMEIPVSTIAMGFSAVEANNCPGLTVENNVVSNICTELRTAHKNIDVFSIINSDNAAFTNNLIDHFILISGSDPAQLIKGFYLKNCIHIEVANNTIDRMDTSDAFFINQCFGYFFDGYSTVNFFTNNIATRIYSSGSPPPLARGVCAYEGTLVVCDFTDIWDIGPGSNGANYHGSAAPGVGTISANPLYINPDNGEYDLPLGSPAQMGDPSFVDWDDTGSPSGDPDNTDTNTRSRMGCHGGPGGEIVGLLTPE